MCSGAGSGMVFFAIIVLSGAWSFIVCESEAFWKGRRTMNTAWGIGIVVLLAVGLGRIAPVAAQGELDRLESGIRISNSELATTVAAGQRVYLGAVADDDAGRGVRVLSVGAGGPPIARASRPRIWSSPRRATRSDC